MYAAKVFKVHKRFLKKSAERQHVSKKKEICIKNCFLKSSPPAAKESPEGELS